MVNEATSKRGVKGQCAALPWYHGITLPVNLVTVQKYLMQNRREVD